jgi:hypothetical protein
MKMILCFLFSLISRLTWKSSHDTNFSQFSIQRSPNPMAIIQITHRQYKRQKRPRCGRNWAQAVVHVSYLNKILLIFFLIKIILVTRA